MIFNNDRIDEVFVPTSASQLIAEQYLIDICSNGELNELVASKEDYNLLTKDTDILTERSIVKLDKKAKLSRAFKAAVFTIAREKKDRDFKKLLTLWRMERVLETKLIKRYKTEAAKRAKQSVAKVNRAASSPSGRKSKVVKSAVAKARSQFSGSSRPRR